ncbi:MAG: hypothetical protein ABIL09_29115 [Gemmatimonadota bacterium]
MRRRSSRRGWLAGLGAALALGLSGGCASRVVPAVETVLAGQVSGRAAEVAADSAGRGQAAGPGPALAAPAAVTDPHEVLRQVVLFLPFSDASKYRGPWDIHSGLPRAVGAALEGHEFLRVVAVDSALGRLTRDERRGHLTAARAVEVARQVGADWAVLGEIEGITMKRFQATVPVGGYRRYEGWATATLAAYRAIDGQRAGEYRSETMVDSKRTGIVNPATYVPLDRQYLLLDTYEWGSPQFWESLVGQAVTQCAADLGAGLSGIVRPPAGLTASEPKIIDVDGAQAYVNAGLAEGIRNGDKYGVWDLGRELKDPDTGAVLGQALPRRVGAVQVEQVLNDHLSQVRILDGQERIEVHYTLRAE